MIEHLRQLADIYAKSEHDWRQLLDSVREKHREIEAEIEAQAIISAGLGKEARKRIKALERTSKK